MVVQRIISKRKYILAGVLTILIFLLGISLGMIIDNERFRWIEQVNDQQQVNYESLQFQYLLLNELERTNASCSVMHATLEDSMSDLGYSLDKFLEYQEQSTLTRDSSKTIERRYLVDNLKYWLFSQKSKKSCSDIDLVNILYFYSEDDCDTCPNQGVILTYFKKKFKEKLLIFPINIDLEPDEQSIRILRMRYGVTTYPSIVIEDQKFQGVISQPELKRLICSSFKFSEPGCENEEDS